MKFKRMLCCVDFLQASVMAFEVSVELARSLKADLHIMHVIEAEPATPDLSLHEKALAAMDALVAPTTKETRELKITTEVTTGSASAEILNRARDRKVDLIVLGAKGLTLLEEAAFGGTGQRVMNHATCSVLAVRGAKNQAA